MVVSTAVSMVAPMAVRSAVTRVGATASRWAADWVEKLEFEMVVLTAGSWDARLVGSRVGR